MDVYGSPFSAAPNAQVKPPGPSARVSIALVVVGLVVAIPTFVAGLLPIIHALQSSPRLEVPGGAVPARLQLHLGSGAYLVYEDTGASSFGNLNSGGDVTLNESDVTVTGADGTTVAVTGPGSVTQTITRDGRRYTGAVRFTTPAAGDYTDRGDEHDSDRGRRGATVHRRGPVVAGLVRADRSRRHHVRRRYRAAHRGISAPRQSAHRRHVFGGDVLGGDVRGCDASRRLVSRPGWVTATALLGRRALDRASLLEGERQSAVSSRVLKFMHSTTSVGTPAAAHSATSGALVMSTIWRRRAWVTRRS